MKTVKEPVTAAAFVQHTTNPTPVTAVVEFFRSSDFNSACARDLIARGFQEVEMIVDLDDLCEDYETTVEKTAEAWCYQTHGVGSFFRVRPN